MATVDAKRREQRTVVYGASDDLVEVEGAITEEFGYTAWTHVEDKGNLLAFSNGMVLRIRYAEGGVWRITPEHVGAREGLVIEQAPQGADDYSDKAFIDGPLEWVVFGTAMARKA